MTRLEQAVEARLQELRDVARSGVTERTGKGAGRRIRGMRSSYPELARLPERDSPSKVASAIERGKGKIYRRIHASVKRELEPHFPVSRQTTEKPTVAPHQKLSAKCKVCGKFHGKGQHRFHGEGAYHRTHLFSFNPKRYVEEISPELRAEQLERAKPAFVRALRKMSRDVRSPYASTARLILGRPSTYWTLRDLEEANRLTGVYVPTPILKINSIRNPPKKPVTIYGNVERIYLAKGHYDLKGKPKMLGLPGGELYITWGRRGPHSDAQARPLGKVRRIDAQKTQPHRCDTGCKSMQHRYYHQFKAGNQAWMLANGDILIRS